LLSLFFVYGLNGGVIKEFFLADLSLTKNRELLLSIAGSSLVMGFLAGIYPAFYSTAFNPAFVIKISSAVSYSNKRLRDTLITVQFIGVIFLVITASFIKVQHKYMQDKSWGINKENVVYLSVRQILPTISDFENEIKKNPDIFDVTYASSLPGNDNMWTWGVSFKEISNLDLRMFAIKSNFLRFFGIDVIEGRDFKEEDDPDIAKIIFNRTLVNRYNLEDAIGEKFPNPKTGGTSEIIGIAKDFNYQSLKEFIRPVGFMTGESISYLLSYMFLKVNGQNTSKTIDYVRNVWKTFSNEPVDVIFLDETLRQLYKQEENLAKLLSIFSLITIIVAVMGVYGLILFNAKSKRKTIALHKINGASITDVILMLNRGFLMQFAVAYVIAVPVAYYTVNRWLENFVYKTPVHWWMFVAGGLLVFLITAATVSWQSYKAATANPVEALKGE
jgi:putative ABC transport system permease protein